MTCWIWRSTLWQTWKAASVSLHPGPDVPSANPVNSLLKVIVCVWQKGIRAVLNMPGQGTISDVAVSGAPAVDLPALSL